MRHRGITVAVALLFLPVLGAGLFSAAEAQSFVGDRIVARLEPPHTYYDVSVRILEDLGTPLEYEWGRTNLCGAWTAFGSSATWEHGDTSDCEHLGGGRHDGTIRVVVTDASGWSVTCEYPYGSVSGEAPCGDPEEPSAVATPPPPTTTSRRPPVVKIVEPAPGTIARNGTDMRVYWTATDPDGDIDAQVLTVTNAAGAEKDRIPMWNEPREAEVPAFAVREAGLYTITVTATDKTGLVGTSTAQVLLTPHSVAIGELVTTTAQGCTLSVGGQMQPSQGVWQDDTQFPDRPGLQLVREEPAVLEAQTPMVVDRDTALFGVRQPRGEVDQGDAMRRVVFLAGETRGSVPVPAFLRASIETSAGERELWRSTSTWMLHLDGPCDRAPHPFLAALPADLGALPTPFQIDEPGGYALSLELHRLDTGAPTGLRLAVHGEAVETRAPSIVVAPVTLTGRADGPEGSALVTGNATRIARDIADNASDLMPTPTQRWPTRTMPTLDLTHAVFKANVKDNVNDKVARFVRALRSGGGWATATEDVIEREVTAALIADKLATGATLAGGERTIVVLSNPDYDRMDPPEPGSIIYASANAKVVFVRQNASLGVVLHELTHTLPYLWSGSGMMSECGVDYHNENSVKGAGGRVTLSGAFLPAVLKPGIDAYMGAGAGNHAHDAILPQWTEQCTYRHLVDALQEPIDPPVLVVRALVAPAEGAGTLLPPYLVDSFLDAPTGGSWAFVARDAGGAEVVRHPFEPVATDSHGRPRLLLPVLARLPAADGMATLELHGPAGLVESMDLGGAAPPAPHVSTTPPDPMEGDVTLAWTSPPGTLTTILHSDDAGSTWTPVVIESNTSSAILSLEAGEHVFRSIVIDGARSASLDTALRVLARPEPPLTPGTPSPARTPTTATPDATRGEAPAGVVQPTADAPLAGWVALAAIALALHARRR